MLSPTDRRSGVAAGQPPGCPDRSRSYRSSCPNPFTDPGLPRPVPVGPAPAGEGARGGGIAYPGRGFLASHGPRFGGGQFPPVRHRHTLRRDLWGGRAGRLKKGLLYLVPPAHAARGVGHRRSRLHPARLAGGTGLPDDHDGGDDDCGAPAARYPHGADARHHHRHPGAGPVHWRLGVGRAGRAGRPAGEPLAPGYDPGSTWASTSWRATSWCRWCSTVPSICRRP